MTTWKSCSAVERDPEKVSGAWVFCGTRVPVAALFENLRDGATIEQFLDWFGFLALSARRSKAFSTTKPAT